MEKNNNNSPLNLAMKGQIKINSNAKKVKTQIIPINRKMFRPISKVNIKNINKGKKNIKSNQFETTIKPVLNTTSKLEVKSDFLSRRVITPNKARLSHHSIDCRTPNKIRNKKMNLSINNIIGNVYYNNNNYRKFNFEKIRNKTPNLSTQNSAHEIVFPYPKNNLINETKQFYTGGEQLKIIQSLKNELKIKNEENNKLKNELSSLLNKDNNNNIQLNKKVVNNYIINEENNKEEIKEEIKGKEDEK